MNWRDMDHEERCQAIWRGTHDGLLVKQIASELGTISKVIIDFGHANDIAVRVRFPAVKNIPIRKQHHRFSTQSTLVTPTRTKPGLDERKALATRREPAHAGT
jgi:hypothetical protein